MSSPDTTQPAPKRRSTSPPSIFEGDDAKTVAKEKILSCTLKVRDHLCLYAQELGSINAAAPEFRDIFGTKEKLVAAFGTLQRWLSTAIDSQGKKEAYRVELTLERAHAAVLAIQSRKPSEYDGFRVKKTIERSADRIKHAYDDMPARFSLMPDEIEMIRSTWYMTGITIHRAGIQPASAENARILLTSLFTGRMDYMSVFIAASALIHETEKYSNEIRLSNLLDLRDRARKLEENTAAIFEKLKVLETVAPTSESRDKIRLLARMAQLVYRGSLELEKVSRQHIAAAGCPSVAPLMAIT